jgi:deazaflavin-dependent oxidoreductase (nitroreductase family)
MIATPSATPTADVRYRRPGAFTRRVFNPLIARLTRWGISVKGTRVLEVRGRTTGEPRSTVVNLLTIDGVDHLVAPRGSTQWVRNLRAGGEATLRLGRRTDLVAATEIDDDAKIPVIRAYLAAWGWEVGKLVEGLRADSGEAEIRAAAPGFPVFVVRPR